MATSVGASLIMEIPKKIRTQSRCREWEKERRNKFNKAITTLGDRIKTVKGMESDMTQCSKIEIIQKAIAFITDNSEDISRLKAQILALQVQLEEKNKNKQEKKDACTQISFSAKTKLKSLKYNKSLIVKKCKHNALKEKPILPKQDLKTPPMLAAKPSSSQGGVFILPKAPNTKARENTFVVVPATPYVIPQRPLILPAAPPTFILLNPNNMQTLNNPVGPKTSKDSTKTTMVNVLPISAYSHPLSANKPKRIKNDAGKKRPKAAKKNDSNKIAKDTHKINNRGESGKLELAKESEILTTETHTDPQSKGVAVTVPNKTDTNIPKENTESNKDSCKSLEVTIPDLPRNNTEATVSNITTSSNSIDNTKQDTSQKTQIKVPPILDTTMYKCIKMDNVKETVEPQEKQSKMPSILDTALCESTVDGGNARLELAEELLAASPTAAFLMSFPLVSGNRADSPAEETQPQIITEKENERKIPDASPTPTTFFNKPHTKEKPKKPETSSGNIIMKMNDVTISKADQVTAPKKVDLKSTNAINVSTDSPFLNLQMPSIVSSGCNLPDTNFALDFDCNISKSLPSQTTSYVSNNNLFYKGDTFNSVKNSIYSTSSISSGHDFNSLGLYPCAMEKYTSKNKSDFSNVDESLMKIGSSRLTYDIDLGWSQKSLDFVNCTTNSTTFSKDNLLTSVASSYTSSYNPFNTEFHVPLVGNTNKKDNFSKASSSFADTITNFYPQTSGLWSEDVPFYTNSGITSSKPPTNKHASYLQRDHIQAIVTTKQSILKTFDTKQVTDNRTENTLKSSTPIMVQMPEKYTKKSPSKMHINWMTSEIRPSQNVCNAHPNDIKELTRTSYGQFDQNIKKHDDGNYFPISVPNHNYPTQVPQEDFLVWPSTRPLGTTEISIEPPPINLPTLVGDLALGPHEKKKHAEMNHRVAQPDQNCNNFLSVTQLMNRSSENMTSRFPIPDADPTAKSDITKQNIPHYSSHRKSTRLEPMTHPCYPYDTKTITTFDTANSFTNIKTKPLKANDKSTKIHKNSYSAEALIRGGGSATQKVPDKFMMPTQKYNEYNPQQDSSVAQVSHFPPMIDYSENNLTGQQFSGTNLYNSTTNTISNSFYTNFMPGSSNLMTTNYTGTQFTGEFIDYSQSAECNYPNNKYEEFRMRGNLPVFQHDKPANKTTKREMTAKHKMECSKKDSKRYQSKKSKVAGPDEWSDNTNLLWQNKTPSKRYSNIDEQQLGFPNYVGNQMTPQYQSEIFNSHIMANVQNVGPNVDRSLASFPPTSRANFNLSTIFPEITMKVQS